VSHFAYTRTPGTWTLSSALLSSEMADIDAKIYKAINGDEGGAWTPSTAIQIGGAGFSFGGATGHRVISGSALYIESGAAFQAESGATFTLDNGVTVSVQAAFIAGGGGTLTGSWGFNGTHTVGATGSFILASGSEATSAAGSLVAWLFDGASSGTTWQSGAFCSWSTGTTPTTDAGSTFTFNGTATHNGTTNLAGTVNLSGAMTCSEPITLSSNGTIKWRAYLGTDADVTILADAYDEVHVVAATPTADRTYTLAGTAVEGQRFKISYMGASYKVTLSYNGGTTIDLKNVTTKYTKVELTYISGTWRMTGYTLVP